MAEGHAFAWARHGDRSGLAGLPAQRHSSFATDGLATLKTSAALQLGTGKLGSSLLRGEAAVQPWKSSVLVGRGKLWPGGLQQVPGPESGSRALACRTCWPDHIEQAVPAGSRGLIPRGTMFEYHMQDPVEPRRSGTYQFCIVGVDMSAPAHPRYHAWEATGQLDRTFSADEVDQKLALQHFGRSVALSARGRQVVRWADTARSDSVIHGQQLPDVDERGRPILPRGSKFVPRNSTDLLGPMLLRWKRGFTGQSECSPQFKILVLDGTGRFAEHVQDEFPKAQVLAVDEPRRFRRSPLKTFRFPIDESVLDRSHSTLALTDGSMETVILPFAFHRICGGDEARFLTLVREALRVARQFVLIAEDVVAPCTDEAAMRRWKVLLQAQWSAPVLLDAELWRGGVADHFLSESGVAETARRFFIIDAAGAGAGTDQERLLKLAS